MIVAYRNGAAVRLADVAKVIDSVQDDKQFAMLYGGEYGYEGTKGITMAVFRQPGSNTIQVVDNFAPCCRLSASRCPPLSTWACAETAPRISAKRSRTFNSPWPPLSAW